jgi:hypothetical protein
VVSFTPRPLYPQRNSPWYPLDRRLGGPQSRSERGGLQHKKQNSITCLCLRALNITLYDKTKPIKYLKEKYLSHISSIFFSDAGKR